MPGQKINLNCTRKLLILTYRARSLFGSLFGDAVFLVVVIWQLLAMNDGTTLVWPDLFFCKELSLVVNKQDQRTMKTTIKYFWPFCRFRIEGWKQHNSDFQSFFYVKNWWNHSDFFHWRISKKEANFYYIHFLITLIFNALYFLTMRPNIDVWY